MNHSIVPTKSFENDVGWLLLIVRQYRIDRFSYASGFRQTAILATFKNQTQYTC